VGDPDPDRTPAQLGLASPVRRAAGPAERPAAFRNLLNVHRGSPGRALGPDHQPKPPAGWCQRIRKGLAISEHYATRPAPASGTASGPASGLGPNDPPATPVATCVPYIPGVGPHSLAFFSTCDSKSTTHVLQRSQSAATVKNTRARCQAGGLRAAGGRLMPVSGRPPPAGHPPPATPRPRPTRPVRRPGSPRTC
jgi:hypothetical protein